MKKYNFIALVMLVLAVIACIVFKKVTATSAIHTAVVMVAFFSGIGAGLFTIGTIGSKFTER